MTDPSPYNGTQSEQGIPESSVEEMLAARLALSSVKVTGANRTSPALLNRITAPVLSTGGTFSSVVEDISKAVDLLRATDCYRGVDAFIDTSSASSSAASVNFTLAEKSFYQIQTGTFVESTNGARHDPSLQASFVLRNITGHADSLKASFSWMSGAAGDAFSSTPSTRLHAHYNRPFAISLSSGVFAGAASSLHNHEDKSSHSLSLRSAQCGITHPFGRLALHTVWRHVMDLDDRASPIVHHDAGHSFKTSFEHIMQLDSRDSHRIPSMGQYLSLVTEATLPLGDVSFAKLDVTAQQHFRILSSSASIAFALRAGAVISPKRTSVIDRFYLGGPASFRGFGTRGIGPRDRTDAVGGDAYYTASAMLSIPFPKSSLLAQWFNARMQVFGTAGDLSDLPTLRTAVSALSANAPPISRLTSTWRHIYDSMRMSTGVGVALETAVGRVEANFCRVLRSSDTDAASTGVQFGISESFS